MIHGQPGAIAIRDARESECDALTALCFRSKASWGYDAEFLEQCRSVLTVTPRLLRETRVRVAEAPDGVPLGLASVRVERVPSGLEGELELLFVEPVSFRSGVGRALLTDVLRELRARGARCLWILSDPGAEPFYVAMGAARVGMRPSDAIVGRSLPWLRLDV